MGSAQKAKLLSLLAPQEVGGENGEGFDIQSPREGAR